MVHLKRSGRPRKIKKALIRSAGEGRFHKRALRYPPGERPGTVKLLKAITEFIASNMAIVCH
jgi:hypothetical protein